jgi:hypothetical protein
MNGVNKEEAIRSVALLEEEQTLESKRTLTNFYVQSLRGDIGNWTL